MPELPAMENFRRLIEAEALGRRVAAVAVGKGRVVAATKPELEALLLGQKLTAARRYGKYVFVRAGAGAGNKGGWLAFHCGLTGYFEVLDAEDEGAKAKLLLRFADGGALAFFDPRMFGRVAIVQSPEALVAEQKLGPDAAAIPRAAFIAALAGSGQPLKGFLLDQSHMAGVGNVYADEMLFRTKLNPRRKAKTLNKGDAGRLHAAMGAILKTAIARKAALDDWGRLPASWLARHRAVGAICPRCGGSIADDTVAGRHGYYCPHCQPPA